MWVLQLQIFFGSSFHLHFGPFNARCTLLNLRIGLINLELKRHQTFMNICTIFNTSQNQS